MKTLALLPTLALCASAEVVSEKVLLGDDPKKTVFVIHDPEAAAPKAGFKLLLILPGGDGSAQFNPFLTNLRRHALGADYLALQLVAPKWAEGQRIIWPTEESKVPGMTFSTSEFIATAIKSAGTRHKVDPKHVYTLSWSSGGPAAYDASLRVPELTGSFIAMSVFKPQQLPPLEKAKGHSYYLLHSPDDRVCPIRLAREAEEQLGKAGAAVKFTEYAGGHGWHGNPFAHIKTGLAWLEARNSD